MERSNNGPMNTLEKTSISSFPKIWSIGSPEAENLFIGEVEVTEKIDGSQFAFGKLEDGTLITRSKGRVIYPETADKMFKPVVDYVNSIQDRIEPGQVFYGEAVTRLKHNTLSYERLPKNGFVLFGVLTNGKWISEHNVLSLYASALEVDVVPLLYKGTIQERSQLDAILQTVSFLGKEIIEGVVIKNYEQLAKSAFSRECFAKIVRPEFKERHGQNPEYASKKDKMEDFLLQFKTEARWNKAIFRLRDQGQLESSPKDIGKLIVEIQKDIVEEEEQFIKEALYQMFKKQILGTAVKGLPEYYKEKLIEKQFNAQ